MTEADELAAPMTAGELAGAKAELGLSAEELGIVAGYACGDNTRRTVRRWLGGKLAVPTPAADRIRAFVAAERGCVDHFSPRIAALVADLRKRLDDRRADPRLGTGRRDRHA